VTRIITCIELTSFAAGAGTPVQLLSSARRGSSVALSSAFMPPSLSVPPAAVSAQ